MKVLPGQLDLFRVDDYLNDVVSNFSSGITPISTRTKVCVKKHPPIKRETIERIAIKLAALPSLK